MTKVWVLQHAHSETLGRIEDILALAGITADYIRPFTGQAVPKDMRDAAGLIVMGGPMGVYEHPRFPFLREEMRLIENAVRDEKPILGICLGSQLLAGTLGAAVTKGKQREIGWFPVRLLDSARVDTLWTEVDDSFTAYHWHGDIFDLPRGATLLATSDQTECQAFCYGHNAYGFLFHLEVTERIVQEMVEAFAEELKEACIDGREVIRQAREHLPTLHRIGDVVFRRWADLVAGGTSVARSVAC
jgi:GMP synthase (glutamine-hydrolysing)